MYISVDRSSGSILVRSLRHVMVFDRLTGTLLDVKPINHRLLGSTLRESEVEVISCLVDRAVGVVALTRFLACEVISRSTLTLEDYNNYKSSLVNSSRFNASIPVSLGGIGIEQDIYVLGGC